MKKLTKLFMMLVTINIFMCFNLEARVRIVLNPTVDGPDAYNKASKKCSKLCQAQGFEFDGNMDEYHDEYDACYCSSPAQPVVTPKPAPAQSAIAQPAPSQAQPAQSTLSQPSAQARGV